MASIKGDLVPITREFLKKWCETLSPPQIPPEFQEATVELDGLLSSLSQSEPGASVSKKLIAAGPKKIDENLFRCREQCELLLEILDKKKGSPWEAAAADFRGQIQSTFERVEEFQRNNNERVRKLIADFLPKDFRASMVAYQHERSEKQKQAEIQKLREKGGTITDKYNMLWAQQLSRREKLVALGHASGVWKALIKLLAGVPSVLLDFVKTINDDLGPVEEIRLVCAPNLYRIRETLNKLHVVIAIAVNANLSPDVVLPIATKTATILGSFSVVYLDFLNHVFVNAPWFVTASELAASGALAAGGADSDYIKLSIEAGGKFNVPIDVTAPATIGWEFKVESKDVAFVVLNPDGSVAVPSQRYQSSDAAIKGTLAAHVSGQYVLQFDNSYSYMTGKTVFYRSSILADMSDADPLSPAK